MIFRRGQRQGFHVFLQEVARLCFSSSEHPNFFCTFFGLISSSWDHQSACYKQWAIVRCILGEVFCTFFCLISSSQDLHVINNGRLYGVFWGKRAKQPLGCWCFVEKIHYVDNIVFILDTNHAISHLCKFYVNILFYFYNQILLLKEGTGHLEGSSKLRAANISMIRDFIFLFF